MANVNKVLGAVGLTETSGSLANISSDVLNDGDSAFVVTSFNNDENPRFYVFKCAEYGPQASPPSQTPGPFSDENPPLVITPSDNPNTTKRWHLASINGFRRNIKQEIGKYIQTSKLKCYDNFSIEDVNGNDIFTIDGDGKIWMNNFSTSNSSLVENFNAESVTGIHGDNLMTIDGTRQFTDRVHGIDPIHSSHLSTKNYVDNKFNGIDSDTFMKKDGSTAFLAPTSSVNPISDYHIATKIYVDTEIEEKLETLINREKQIIYKNGLEDIPQNTTEVTVIFGGTLENYTIHPCIQNIIDEKPAGFILTITDQTSSSFTIDLNGYTDTENYKLSWMIVSY